MNEEKAFDIFMVIDNLRVASVNCKYMEAYMKDAMEVLNNRIPLPVIYPKKDYLDTPIPYCPSCKERIEMYIFFNGKKTNFCPYCGQAVKWNG